MNSTDDKKRIAVTASALLVIALTGCTPAQHLDTPELRAEALGEELTLVTEALETFDAAALRELACEQTGIFEPPRAEELPDDVDLPVSVVVADVEMLELSGSAYEASDPGAELHLASTRQVASTITQTVPMPDVIVRVDEREACLWAMGPRFAVLLGL